MELEDLPHEIQSKILSCVPLEHAVLSCKLVSKTWNSLLSHRKLAGGLLVYIAQRRVLSSDVKFRFGYFDEILTGDKNHEECFVDGFIRFTSYLIGSCNGLVCLSIPDYHNNVSNDYVFNPVTGECFNLPTIDNQSPVDRRIVTGFGYDPCSRNYKVVKIHYPKYQFSPRGSVYIYTLGGGDSSGWRHIGDIDYSFFSEGILWNGSLHWLDENQGMIITFDLVDEKFGYLATKPPCSKKPLGGYLSYWGTQFKVLGGYLSVVNEDRGIPQRTDIWLFKNKHKDDNEGYQSWTWSLEFSIQPSPFSDWHKYDRCVPFAITKNNQVLLWYKHVGGCQRPPVLCRYDPKTHTLNAVNKILDWDAHGVSEFEGIPHVNSLVSLKDLGVDSKSIAEFAAERM